jgi:hypothetical protein
LEDLKKMTLMNANNKRKIKDTINTQSNSYDGRERYSNDDAGISIKKLPTVLLLIVSEPVPAYLFERILLKTEISFLFVSL